MLQENTTPYDGDDVRKYEVGRPLRFVGHSPGETIVSECVPGDAVVVLARNGCGMGIDVRRDADGLADMVWADEVELYR